MPLTRGWILWSLQSLPTQSALHPAGVQAARIYGLGEFLLVTSAVVFVIVIGATVYAAAHRRRDRPEAEADRVMRRWVSGAIVGSLVVLFLFIIVDFDRGRVLATPPPDAEALTISIKGHQWWWEVEYPDSAPQRRVTTANEVHVPVGRPIELRLTSSDVIHSFWVPNLHGKKDLIPGHQSVTWFQADRPGVYQGQCAEFCGHEHALMRLVLVAESPAQFAAWYQRQLQPAAPPTEASARRGQEVFLSGSCMLCHTVAGTTAGGRTGPDLTHLAGRRTLAAGTLANTRGNLGGWVVDPHSIKPGVLMPANPLSPRDLNALLDYLETLR
jgi:cytochrome c oxidase subunit II